MTKEYIEWDGEHVEGLFLKFFEDRISEATPSKNTLDAYCDCFHLKGCCSVAFDGKKLHAGDRIYHLGNGEFELVPNPDTEIVMCPVHKVEHLGTGPFLCTYTGQLE